MILRSKLFLLELLLAICVCCHIAAPLRNRRERLIEHKPRHPDESTEISSANEPIKVLRSTDHDIIIQIRRSPIKQSNHEGIDNDKDTLEKSDVSMYNKHKKSKLKSFENHERESYDDTFVGQDIITDRAWRSSMQKSPTSFKPVESKEFPSKDINNHSIAKEKRQEENIKERISRLSMHKSPTSLKPFESKEFPSKDINNHPLVEETGHEENIKERVSRLSMHKLQHISPLESKEFSLSDKHDHRLLEDTEDEKPYQGRNGQSNRNPYNFVKYVNKDSTLDKEVMEENPEDNRFNIESLHTHKSLKDVGQIDQADEENKKHKIESMERKFSDNQGTPEGDSTKLSLDDRKNKRELIGGSSNVWEPKSSRTGIDMKTKRNYEHFEGSKEESVPQSPSSNPDSVQPPKIAVKTISVKVNNVVEKQKSESTTKATTIIQDIENELNEGQNKLPVSFDQKEPLRDKIIKTRSPALDSLQDLKRKFQIDQKKLPLLPRPSVVLPRKTPQRFQTFGVPPIQAPSSIYAPSNGQYNLLRQPRATEDPVVQAERTKTALQRMILFVNAMGKFDYYVSNAARNFVDLLTHHTHDYDDTVRSRYAGNLRSKDPCGGEKDKRHGNDDDDDDNDDGRVGYVRIRTSKAKRHSHEHGEHTNPTRLRDRPYSESGEYGW